MKKAVLLVYWVLFSMSYPENLCAIDAHEFFLNYLYPQTNFHRVELIGKELWSDLDLLLNNRETISDAINSNYLRGQCINLLHATQKMCSEHEETRNYLPDDVEYLIEIVSLLENKWKDLSGVFNGTQFDYVDEYNTLFSATKILLKQLLISTKEYVISLEAPGDINASIYCFGMSIKNALSCQYAII
jgi:hypothetical protein